MDYYELEVGLVILYHYPCELFSFKKNSLIMSLFATIAYLFSQCKAQVLKCNNGFNKARDFSPDLHPLSGHNRVACSEKC